MAQYINYGEFVPIGNPQNALGIGDQPNEYDFRINLQNTQEFFYLGLLNLALILCEKLNIDYILNENNYYRIIRNNNDITYLRNDPIPENSVEIVCRDNAQYVSVNMPGNNLHTEYLNLNTLRSNGRTIKRDIFKSLPPHAAQDYQLGLSLCYTSGLQDIANVIVQITVPHPQPHPKIVNELIQLNQNHGLLPNRYYLIFHEAKNQNDANMTINSSIEITKEEFISLVYNTLPTPHFSEAEINRGNLFIQQQDNNDNYDDVDQEIAIAVDPSLESKDKDDAISFTIDNDANLLIMKVFIADVTSYLNHNNIYPFLYAQYKSETEYNGDKTFPLIDRRLSENKLSLMGDNNRAVCTTITYNLNQGILYPIPQNVEIQKVKNLKVYYTTYEAVHQFIVNVQGVNNLNNVNLGFSTIPLSLNRVVPSNFNLQIDENILDNMNNIFHNDEDQPLVIENDRINVLNQLKNMHTAYGLLSSSVESYNSIKTKFWPSDEYNFSLTESWIHALIEITALETNSYNAMIQYNQMSNNNHVLTIDRNNIIASINHMFDASIGGDTNNFYGFYRGEQLNNNDQMYPHNNILDNEYRINREIIQQLDNQENYTTDITKIKYILDKDDNRYFHQSIIFYLNYRSYYLNDNYVKMDSRLKAKNVDYILSHKDVNCVFYTYFTSPLRRFIDICVHSNLFDIGVYRQEFTNSYQNKIFNEATLITYKSLNIINILRQNNDNIDFVAHCTSNRGYYVPLLDKMFYYTETRYQNQDVGMGQFNDGTLFSATITLMDDFTIILNLTAVILRDDYTQIIFNNYNIINNSYNNTPYEQDYILKHIFPNSEHFNLHNANLQLYDINQALLPVHNDNQNVYARLIYGDYYFYINFYQGQILTGFALQFVNIRVQDTQGMLPEFDLIFDVNLNQGYNPYFFIYVEEEYDNTYQIILKLNDFNYINMDFDILNITPLQLPFDPYYSKYIKYKNKYLELRNKLK